MEPDSTHREILNAPINVADLIDPSDPLSRTNRQINETLKHTIPIGTLVELKTGDRLRIAAYTRDCDQTPMYTLSVTGHEEDRFGLPRGYVDNDLKVIVEPDKEETSLYKSTTLINDRYDDMYWI
jgi:hypothetical protein